MKKSKTEIGNIIGITLLIIAFITCFVLCIFVIFNVGKDSKHVHVHFINTNECYDVKRTWAQNGIVWVTFNDDSSIKVGANNVVVYVDHVCEYCGK